MYARLHYITLHYRHFKRHLHLNWPVVRQKLHVIRNTAHRPSTQASYTTSRVRPKMKISCAAAQIAATLTISFPRWRHMSLTSYWGQQRMSLTSYPGLNGLDWLHAHLHAINGPHSPSDGLVIQNLQFIFSFNNINNPRTTKLFILIISFCPIFSVYQWNISKTNKKASNCNAFVVNNNEFDPKIMKINTKSIHRDFKDSVMKTY